MTEEQLQKQARIEEQYNAISDTVLSHMPFGAFYGMMQTASKMGESFLKKKVCIDSQGRLITSYKTTSGKVVAAYLKPQHELLTEQASKKKFGKAILASMPIVGQTLRVREQQKLEKSGRCFDMTVEEFLAEKERRDEIKKKEELNKLVETKTREANKIFGMEQKTFMIVLVSVLVVGFFYMKNKNQ